MVDIRVSALALSALTFAACGGGGGGGTSTPSPTPTPTPPSSSTPWNAVEQTIEDFGVQDIAVIIGDATGELYRFERGEVNVNTSLNSASSSKFLTGLTLITLIEDGFLDLSTGPADVLDFWVADDLRSEVRLRQLFSFTSGFNARPVALGCWTIANIELQTCAERIYTNGLDENPGDTFSYGPEHLQIAAAMAEVVYGEPFVDVFRQQVAVPQNLSPSFRFATPSTRNPRAGAGAIVNAADYAILLAAVLNGDSVANFEAYLGDFTDGAEIAFSPAQSEGRDWRYGLGYWVECDQAVFDESCAQTPTISSVGAFGFTPWIDFENGYYGVIAMEETNVGGRSGGDVASSLEQTLQPLIEEALDQIR